MLCKEEANHFDVPAVTKVEDSMRCRIVLGAIRVGDGGCGKLIHGDSPGKYVDGGAVRLLEKNFRG